MLKTKEELINEGRPLIEYTMNGKTYTQVFLFEWACETRIRELTDIGIHVERKQ